MDSPVDGSLGEHVGPRTTQAMALAATSGVVAGISVGEPLGIRVIALAVAALFIVAGFYRLPSAEETAIRWRESERIEEDQP